MILALGDFIERHKGGSPTDATIFWIHLKPREIAQRFTAESSLEVSNGLAKRVLKSKGFRFRKLSKSLPIGKYNQRDLQFRLIFDFKKQLLDLASETGMDFIICHYPPYASKWNPIEHRLFCHVHQAMQGVVLSDYELVRTLIAKTKQGLNVIIRLNLEKYEIGIRTPKAEVDYRRVSFDPRSPLLIYRVAA